MVAETSGRPGDAVFPAPSGAPPSLDQVIAKLGGAYQAALALDGPADDPVLAPFGHLSPQEVGLLAPRMQFNVSAISCALLDARRDTHFPAQSEIAVCEGATASYCSAPCGCRAPTSVTPCPPFSP